MQYEHGVYLELHMCSSTEQCQDEPLHLSCLCCFQVHVGGSLAVLGGKLYVSGGYDSTFELSAMVECYDPETRSWSVAGQLPEPIFWHSSVSIFRQFMPEMSEGEELRLDNATSLAQQRQNRSLQDQNLNELH